MSGTSEINLINIQVRAEPAIARDQAAGVYESRIAADSRFYNWQGTQQLIPLGMDGNPEGFVDGIARALPFANTLRIPFNAYSFNADGSLHPQMERFLTAAAAQGFRLLLVQNDGAAQQTGSGTGWTPDSLAAAIDGPIMDRLESAWRKMAAWLDRNPAVENAVWGYELVNEPAAWMRGAVIAPWGTKQPVLDRFVAMYAGHMERLAAATGADAQDRILVGGWGYSGTFEELARPVMNGRSALDHLEDALNGRLIWSAHLYPGWHATGALSTDAIIDTLTDIYAPLRDRAVLLTEFNLDGARANDTDNTADVVYRYARIQEWLADQGLGLGWFPGVETGTSALASIDANGTLRFLHQHSLAQALNGFTLDDNPAEHAHAERILADLIRGRVRNETTDPDWNADRPFDPVSGIAVAAGHGGADTLIGRDDANGFLYGGQGDDLLIGRAAEDFLFGQSGHDLILGGAGRDHLSGGDGSDTLWGGGGDDVLWGGRGADLFRPGTGTDILADFSAAEGDRLDLGARYRSWAEIQARITVIAHDGPDRKDLSIRHADGSSTIILDAAGRFGAAQVALPGLITTLVPSDAGQGSTQQGIARVSTFRHDTAPGSDSAVITTTVPQRPASDQITRQATAQADHFDFSGRSGPSLTVITSFDPAQDRIRIDGTTLDLARPGTLASVESTPEGLVIDFAEAAHILLSEVWL